MRNFKKEEIFYKDGLIIGVRVKDSKSPRLSAYCAVYEKYQDTNGRTSGVFQIIYGFDGSVFSVHEKFPHDREKFF